MNKEFTSSSSLSDLPRPGSIRFRINQHEPIKSTQTLKLFKLGNKIFVIPLYRLRILPLLGFGRKVLLMKTIGRKSGKQRITPIEYRKNNNDMYVFASRGENADWLKNIRAHPDQVSVQIGFRSKKVRPTIINDPTEEINIFHWYITKFPKAAQGLFGWDPKKDTLEKTAIHSIVNMVTVVRLTDSNS